MHPSPFQDASPTEQGAGVMGGEFHLSKVNCIAFFHNQSVTQSLFDNSLVMIGLMV